MISAARSHSSLTLSAPTCSRRELRKIHVENPARMRKTTLAPRAPPTLSPIHHIRAPIRAAIGKVVAHAVTIRPAVDQRTGVPAAQAATEHRAGGDVGGRQGEAEVARGQQDDGRGAPSLDMPCGG